MDNEDNNDDYEEYDLTMVAAVAGIIVAVTELEYMLPRAPSWSSTYTGHHYITGMLNGNSNNCMNILRMQPGVFYDLCNELANNYGLVATRSVSIREMVGLFIYTVAHGVGNRNVQDRFHHYGETIHRQFHKVLDSICRLSEDNIRPRDPEFRDIPSKIVNDQRYWPFFKDCIGAIDGTHIPATVPNNIRVRFVGRKGLPTQNVMAVCDFDMLFTFVQAGWEGSAHDSRIFHEVIGDEESNFPHPPQGKYYLVDAGYPNRRGYMAPYKGQRYHLEVFRRGPGISGPREAFNHAHSSLRSVIERTFGVLKKKWLILSRMPSYPCRVQVKIVIACIALHNFIRRHVIEDADFREYSNDVVNIVDNGEDIIGNDYGEGSVLGEDMEMNMLRDFIATELFNI